MKLRVIYAGSYNKSDPEPLDVTVPEGARVKWEANQHTVVVADGSGSSIAAFYGVKTFYIVDVVTVETPK